jgi:membrane-associated phospholipid phosphatase
VTGSRRTVLLSSLLPFWLFLLLGVAVNQGWLGTAELDGPSSGIRAWAAERPWLEHSLFLVEDLFATHGLTIATLALVAWLLLRRQFRASAFVLVVMLAARELTGYTKELFGRDRPVWQDTDFLHTASSYPSGHAAGTAAIGGLVFVLAMMGGRSRAHRRPVAIAVSLVVLTVCADRLLLGRHYPTDLIGGVLLATGLIMVGAALLLPLGNVAADAERDATLADDAPSEVAKPELVSRSA